MNLGLKEYFRYNSDGKWVTVQTNFKEKVLMNYPSPTIQSWSQKLNYKPKIHSIREDKRNRWREGMVIHFAHGIRTKHYNCWHKGVCTGVQKVEIYRNSDAYYWEGDTRHRAKLDLVIKIDGLYLPQERNLEFAINDGFDSLEDFKGWFDKDFKGKIVHWTGIRYKDLLKTWDGK